MTDLVERGSAPAVARRRTWVDVSLTVCLVAALLAVGLIFLGKQFGYHLLVGRSDSMAPYLRAGDLLVSQDVVVTGIERGDIVTFHDDARDLRVTHRVIDLAPTEGGQSIKVTTRGDANNKAEKWAVEASSEVGRLAWHAPYAGRVVAALTGLPAMLALIALATVVTSIAALRRIWR